MVKFKMKNPFYNHRDHVKQKTQTAPKIKPQAMSAVINQNPTQQMTLNCDVEEQDDGSQKIICDVPEELQNQTNKSSPQITINNSQKTNKVLPQTNITKQGNSMGSASKSISLKTIKGVSPALAASITNTVKIKHEIHQKQILTEEVNEEDEEQVTEEDANEEDEEQVTEEEPNEEELKEDEDK